MTTNPNGYRTFPAYNAGYGYAPMATAPSSQKPAYPYPPANTPGLPYRTPIAAPNPYGNPYAAQTLQSLTNRSFIDRFMPLQPTVAYPPTMVNAAPQQPMVISLTTPKMTKDEMHKKFWLIAAGGTVAIVSGVLLVSFVGLKILPQRIAGELKGQTHSSMLRALDELSIGKVLKRIKDRALTRESKASDELHSKWGNKSVNDIYGVPKEHDNFLKDIGQHLSVTDLGSLIWQQMFRKTFTPEFIKEQSHSFSDALLSDTAKQTLLQKVAHKPEIQKILKTQNAEGKKLSELSKSQQDAIMKEVYQHTNASESLSAAAAEALQTSVTNSLLTKQNIDEAINSMPSLNAQKAQLDAIADPAEKLNYARSIVTLQDTISHLTRQSIDSAVTPELLNKKTTALLDSVKNYLITEQNLKETIDTIPSLKNRADALNAIPNVKDRLAEARKHVTLQDTLAYLTRKSIDDAVTPELLDQKTAALLASVKNSLITEGNVNDAIQSIPSLKARINEFNGKTQAEKVKHAHSIVSLQDTLGHLTRQSIDSAVTPELLENKTIALLDSAKNYLITKENLKEAIETIPSLQDAATTLNAMEEAERLEHARSLVTLQDTTALLARHSIDSALSTEFQNAKINQFNTTIEDLLKKQLKANPENINKALQSYCLKEKLNGKKVAELSADEKNKIIDDLTLLNLASLHFESLMFQSAQNAKSALWDRVPSLPWPLRSSQPQPSSSIS